MKTIEDVIKEIELRLSDYIYNRDYTKFDNPLLDYKLSGGISALELLLDWIKEPPKTQEKGNE